MNDKSQSRHSLAEADRGRARFSGHGDAKGAAGHRPEGRTGRGDFLSHVGEVAVIDPRPAGYGDIRIAAFWDRIKPEKPGLLFRVLGISRQLDVDIDLGCLYELQDGTKGAVQGLGEFFGDYGHSPFIALSRDEKTGAAEGEDEAIVINGQRWAEIRKVLVYAYIYGGAPDWASVRPRITLGLPGEPAMEIVPDVDRAEMVLCVIAAVENVRNGIKVTNHTEYFPGHAEMDRAFGFGLHWQQGVKQSFRE